MRTWKQLTLASLMLAAPLMLSSCAYYEDDDDGVDKSVQVERKSSTVHTESDGGTVGSSSERHIERHETTVEEYSD
ncbi:MAG TPA: hypothetical protein PLS90_02500 [Candidatus Sumerlaeota bacterium]|nr:hypothetical protein [Candidatus Sumerlaeota bacterium]HOR26784.1 hypothetical protein [Candidatus Sumerlaeota bacterium]HPK01304.1 hypothetical protein [Candidatus Sumerlaeota bacterium]